MKFGISRNVILVLLTLSVSGCAAMFNGSSQMVALRSNVEGSKLYINEEYMGKNSTVTTFKKKENYILTARKEGCEDASVYATKSVDLVTFLGVLIDFGIVSVLLIDGAATGAWQKFDQTSYVLDPVCSA